MASARRDRSGGHRPTAVRRPRPPGRSAPNRCRRALALVDGHTTEMADEHPHGAPQLLPRPAIWPERELQLCRRTPLALAPTAQLPNPHDFVVRDVLGTSVLLDP